jgi:hypothetical protein
MSESQTVSTLRAKRDAIAAAILNYERQLERARSDFTHVTAALAIFEASEEPGSNRVYVSLYRYFRYGEIAAMCRDMLASGAQTTTELAKRIMAEKGLDDTDKVLAQSVSFTVLRSLRGLTKRKTVECERRKGRCLWSLTSEGDAASSLSTDVKPAGALPRGPLLQIAHR